MEKIETLIYLFVLQRALAASLLCSLGIPSHTFESKINSFLPRNGQRWVFNLEKVQKQWLRLGSRNREENLASRDLKELQAWQSTGLSQLWVGSM